MFQTSSEIAGYSWDSWPAGPDFQDWEFQCWANKRQVLSQAHSFNIIFVTNIKQNNGKNRLGFI